MIWNEWQVEFTVPVVLGYPNISYVIWETQDLINIKQLTISKQTDNFLCFEMVSCFMLINFVEKKTYFTQA